MSTPTSFARTINKDTKKVETAPSGINKYLPASAAMAVTTNFNSIEQFRIDTFATIIKERDITGKEVKDYESQKVKKASGDAKILDATAGPIAYVRLLFLLVLGFIFGSQIVFYALLAFLVFIILRFIYRKIRNR